MDKLNSIMWIFALACVVFGVVSQTLIGIAITKAEHEKDKAFLRHAQLQAQILWSTFLIIMWLTK